MAGVTLVPLNGFTDADLVAMNNNIANLMNALRNINFQNMKGKLKLTLGGVNEGNGYLSILNSAGAEVGKIDIGGMWVDGGSYFIKENNLFVSIVPKTNLVVDPTFEAVRVTGSYDGVYHDQPILAATIFNGGWWSIINNPKRTDVNPKYGAYAVLVDAMNKLYFDPLVFTGDTSLKVNEETEYYFSIWNRTGLRTTVATGVTVVIGYLTESSPGVWTVVDSITQILDISAAWTKRGFAFTTPATTQALSITISGVGGWAYLDGCQITEGSSPRLFNTEESLWRHIRGDSGLTHITQNWITPSLENSWVSYGGTWGNVAYCKNINGEVLLKGAVKDGTLGTVCMHLPVGYRPLENQMIPCSDANGYFTAVIYTDGSVTLDATTNTLVSLNSIRFRAEQ